MPDWDTMRALLAGIPVLPGAPCKGRSDLYERTIGEHRAAGRFTTTEIDDARREALRLCNDGCPTLDACRAWLSALPAAQRPRGVVAGQVIMSSGLPGSLHRGQGRDAAVSAVERVERRPVVEDQAKAERAAGHRLSARGRSGADADCEPAHS